MCSHLDAPISLFEKYFSQDIKKYNWIKNPFLDNANASQGFTFLEAKQFIDLTSDLTLKNIHEVGPKSIRPSGIKPTTLNITNFI